MSFTILKNLQAKNLGEQLDEISGWVNRNEKLSYPTWERLFALYLSKMDYATATLKIGGPEEWIREQLQVEWAYGWISDKKTNTLSQSEIDKLVVHSTQNECYCPSSLLVRFGHEKDCNYMKGRKK